MLNRLATLLACALALSAPTPASAQLGQVKSIPTSRAIAGTWYSSRGPVTFETGGAGYIGTFKTPSGSVARLSGFFIDGIFSGTWWTEDDSGQRCATAVYDGQHYWGRFRLAFEGGSFTGRWTVCDAPIEGGDAWGGWNGADSKPAGPQWVFRDASLLVPSAGSLGPGCRLEKAGSGETAVEFDIRCAGTGGKEQKTTGKLSLDIKRPKGWVPGLTFRTAAKLKLAGAPGASATASCRIGLQGTEGAVLFAPLTAASGKETAANGEAVVPAPPACGPDNACPPMSIVCSIAAPHPLVMTRIYTWEQ